MTAGRRYAALAAVMTAWVALAGCSHPAPIGDTTSSGPLGTTLREGERPVAPDLSGTTLEGRTVQLSGYRGEVVVINAWASWCGPCRGEAPELRKLQQHWQARGVQVLGLDNDKSRDDGLAFQRDHRLGYPSLYDPSGRQGLRLPRGLVSPQALPYTVVVDPAGRIAAARMGAVTETELARLVASLLPAGNKAAGRKTGQRKGE